MLGDTVAAWDPANSRVSFFAHGALVGAVPLRLSGVRTFVGMLDGGYFVSTPRAELDSRLFGNDPEAGLNEGDPRWYRVSDPTDSEVATLLGPPEPQSGTFFLDVVGGGPPFVFGPLARRCFPQSLHLTGEGGLFVADASSGRLYALDRLGRTRLLYETGLRETVRPALHDWVRLFFEVRAEVSGRSVVPAERQRVLDRLGDIGEPLAAVWSDLRLDQSGRLWLQRATCYAWLEQDSVSVWEVVGPDGSIAATVSVPREFTILAVDEERVLAGSFDQRAVPRIGLYGLRRLEGR